MKPNRFPFATALILATIVHAEVAHAEADAAAFEQWGRDCFDRTEEQLGRPGEPLYYESRNLNDGSTSGVNGYSFVWPLSTQLRALNQLVKLDPATYTPQLLSLTTAMQAGYWRYRNDITGSYGIGGYAADFNIGLSDRFYDDNAHLVIGFVESYRLTNDPVYLERAKATYDFVKSGGWFDENGDTEGIRFVESPTDRSSNTISVLQGARGAAMLFQETGEQAYLDDAIQLVAWANSHLKTPGNRYYQGYNVDTNEPGGVDIVNGSACGISAHLELYRATGQQSYLDEAVSLAHAALGRFIDPVSSVIGDEGFWAFELVEAFNDLTIETGDLQWLLRSMAGLEWLHENKRDSNGNYGLFWGRNGPITADYNEVALNSMAPVTHAYLDTANTLHALDLPEPTDILVDLKLDETEGATAYDSSGSGNNAALIGNPVWTTGFSGNALDFDGADDHAKLPNGVLANLDDFTMAVWVNPDSLGNWTRVFDLGEDTSRYLHFTPRNGNTQTAMFEIKLGGTLEQIHGPAPLSTGVWTHVAVTLSGSTGILYIDGVEVGRNGSMTLSPADLGVTTNNLIGKSQFSADPRLNGRIDEFKILRYAMSAGEIAALAQILPDAPVNLMAEGGFGEAQLNWSASLGAASYAVSRASTAGGPYGVIAGAVGGTSFIDTAVAANTTYYYVVRAANNAGESGPSNEASATPRQPFVSLGGQQPRVPAWSIDQLLAFDPATDATAPFNVSAVPLEPRIQVPGALQANPNARAGQGRIQSLDTFNAQTSGNAPQGGPGSQYTFSYWQYVSESVYWGGSASEGIVVPPSAEVIDCAHRNGVPMLGTIFFPPTAFGGNYAWVQQFIQRDGNRFPAADKLIEAAGYFGFDGWFINQETNGGSAQDAAALRDLIKYIRDNSDLHVVWYDSMTEAGPILWQDQLNSLNDWYLRHNSITQNQDFTGDRIAENIFLDFVVSTETAQSSRNHASTLLGLDPYKSVYAGFEMQERSFKDSTDARQNISTVFPAGQNHILSAGLYVPRSFAGSLSDQDLFWSGANGDPRDTDETVGTGNWHGIAHHIAAQSPVTSVPFGTSFNLGAGNDFRVNGVSTGKPQWWNRSVQDVLPTWRWIVESTGSKLSPELSMADAYFGGGCLRFSGNLDADNTVRLYLAELPVQADTLLKVVFKRGVENVDSQMQVGVSFASDPTTFHYFDAGSCESAGWNTSEIPVGAFAGETIASIGLKFVAAPAVADYVLKLGQLVVYNEGDPNPEPPAVVELLEQAPGSAAGASDLNLRWVHASGERLYYNVYERDGQGNLHYLGSTPNNHYFADEAKVAASPEIVVVTVGRDYQLSPPSDGLHFQSLVAHKGAYTAAAIGTLGLAQYAGYETVVPTGGTGTALFEIDAAADRVIVRDSAALNAATPGFYTLTADASGGGSTTIAVTVTLEVVASNVVATDKLARQVWTGFYGNLDDLQNLENHPYRPDFIRELDEINDGDLFIDHYGSRIRAYVVPPVSGNYRFYIASDDDSRLRMSTDGNPANAAQIASVGGYVDPNNFTAQGNQTSAPRSLVAGQRYYIDILHREGFGGDHVSLAWTGPGIGSPTVVPDSALEPFNINGTPLWGPGSRSFEVAAFSGGGTVIGTVSGLDPEGEALNHAILAGDPSGRFSLDPVSGQLVLAPGAQLLADETIVLTVGIQDRGLGGIYPLGELVGEITVFTGSPLVVDLKLDEAAGLVAQDSSANGHDATLVNGPVWSPGIIDNAIGLDGNNDHILLPAGVISDLEDFTVSTWVKLDDNDIWSRVFDFGEGISHHMYLTPRNGFDQAVMFEIHSAGVTERIFGTTPLPTGVWTQVAVTLSGSTGILYVNGVEVGRNGSMTLTPADLGMTTSNYIGRSRFSQDPFLDGIVDAFQIHRRALAPGELLELANPPEAPAGLVAVMGDGQVELNWNVSGDASAYALYRSTASGTGYSRIATGLASPGFTDTNVVNGTTYYYVVTALEGLAESARSLEADARPNSPITPEETSAPDIERVGGDIVMTVKSSVAGHRYQLQACDDLGDVWIDYGVPQVGNGGDLTFEIPMEPAVNRRFFRIRIDL